MPNPLIALLITELRDFAALYCSSSALSRIYSTETYFLAVKKCLALHFCMLLLNCMLVWIFHILTLYFGLQLKRTANKFNTYFQQRTNSTQAKLETNSLNKSTNQLKYDDYHRCPSFEAHKSTAITISLSNVI